MSQIDAAIDVAAILSPRAAAVWEPNTGYDHLVVNEDDAVSRSIDFSPLQVGSTTEQALAAAALAFWSDDLPTAHTLFQEDESPDGSLWHAILHRREEDFSNSKYWLARAGRHPVYKTLGRLASDAIKPLAADPLFSQVLQGGWNASAFVDLVRRVANSDDSACRSAAVTLQRLEWRALFCQGARSGH